MKLWRICLPVAVFALAAVGTVYLAFGDDLEVVAARHSISAAPQKPVIAAHFASRLKLIAPDGKPAAGREAFVAAFGEGDGARWTQTLKLRTGEDGTVTIAPDGSGRVELMLVVRGCGWAHYGQWREQADRDTQLQLSPTGSVIGEVRKSDGKPAAGARVNVRTLLPIELTAAGGAEDFDNAKMLDMKSAPWPAQVPLAAGIKSAGITCDENGKFKLPDMIPGTWPVTVSLDGFRSQTDKIDVKAGDEVKFSAVLDLLAERQSGKEAELAEIAGVVESSDGTPVSGATVNLEEHIYFKTGADGKFAFDDCRVGAPYTLKISAPGFVPVRQTITLPKDKAPEAIKIVLKRTNGVIAGRIFDVDEKRPVERDMVIVLNPAQQEKFCKGSVTPPISSVLELVNAQLEEIYGTWLSEKSIVWRRPFEVEQRNFFGLECYHAYSGNEGKFRIENVPDGVYDVVLIRQQWINLIKHGVVVRAGETTEDVNFDVGLKAPGWLVGRMLNENEEPLRGFKIQFTYRITRPGNIIETSLVPGSSDIEGRFYSPLLGPGTYELEEYADGYAPAALKFTMKDEKMTPQGDFIFRRLKGAPEPLPQPAFRAGIMGPRARFGEPGWREIPPKIDRQPLERQRQ